MKVLDIGLLLDFYGELLSPKSREIMRLYYNNDLSLQEVSELVGVTRQGVSDCVRRCGAKLKNYEAKLGLAGKFYGIKENVENIKEMIQKDADKETILNGLDNIVQRF